MSAVLIRFSAVMLLLTTSTLAQNAPALHPFYYTWQVGEAARTTAERSALLWASGELDLAFHRQALPSGIAVRGPKQLVKPYPHLNGTIRCFRLTPSLEYDHIWFREVKDDAEYLLRLQEAESGYEVKRESPGVKLTRSGPDTRRHIHLDEHWVEEEKEVSVRYVHGVKITMRRPMRDRDNNVRLIPRSRSSDWYIRRAGSLILEGGVPEVFEIPEKIVRRRRSFQDDDLTHLIDVSGIPRRTREKLWDQWLGPVNTTLQQFDGENDDDYHARRLLGDNRIELMRSALFDVDSAWFSVSYRDDSQPVKGQAGLDVTSDTELQRMLRSLGQAAPRLPPLESPDEVFSVHLVSRIPRQTADYLTALAGILELRCASSSIIRTFRQTIDEGVLELRLSGQAHREHGLACIGQLRVRNDLHQTEQHLASLVECFPEFQSQLVPGSGQTQYLRMSLEPLSKVGSLLPDWDFVPLPEHAFVQLKENVLWFALGGENAWRILEASQEKAKASAEAGIPQDRYLLQCRVNLALATGEHGAESGLASYLLDLEKRWYYSSLTRGIEVQRVFETDLRVPEREELQYRTISEKALTGRSANGELTLVSHPDGLRASLTVDRALALLYYGRIAVNMEDFEAERRRILQENVKPFKLVPPPGNLLQASEGVRASN